MNDFTVFPAIDLRDGKVVRLEMGDPTRESVFSDDPAEVARRFLVQGAKWLHVINLDGAFGDEQKARKNELAIRKIVEVTKEFEAKIQVGGGLRSVEVIERLVSMGVGRVILGTLAVNQPESVLDWLQRWGTERIAVSLDLRGGKMQTHGWLQSSEIQPEKWLEGLVRQGVRWVMVTDVERDGMLSGANPKEALRLKIDADLRIVLAGGVSSMADIQAARLIGLAGVIIGRALYTGELSLSEVLKEISNAG